MPHVHFRFFANQLRASGHACAVCRPQPRVRSILSGENTMSDCSEAVGDFLTGTISRVSNNFQKGWILADEHSHLDSPWLEFKTSARRRMCNSGIGPEEAGGKLLWKPLESVFLSLADLAVRVPVVFDLWPNGAVKSWGTRDDCVDAIAASWARRYALTPAHNPRRKETCWMGLYIEALGVRVDLNGVFSNSSKGKLLWQTRDDNGDNGYALVHKLSNMFRVLGDASVATLATETQRVLSRGRAAF